MMQWPANAATLRRWNEQCWASQQAISGFRNN